MRLRNGLVVIVGLLAVWGVLRAQKPFREWPAIEYGNFPIPPDAGVAHEWTRARLRYPDIAGYGRAMGGLRFNFPGFWTMDYPRSDRHLLTGVRRLTRIDGRSSEQVVDLEADTDIFNWPFVYGAEVGHWDLSEENAKVLRDYIDRGGFLMVDDFHANQEWNVFMTSLRRVFPSVDVRDIPNDDPIFHTLYDLVDRVQIPGIGAWESGRTYERDESGRPEHWRGVYDSKGRIVVAICHNMDLGDAWEHSDDPDYPEKYASIAYRIAMNYFVYDLTH